MSSFLEEIRETTRVARRSRSSNFIHRLPLEKPFGIYGRDAGSDYASSILDTLKEFMAHYANGKESKLSLHTDVIGPAATDGFVETLRSAFPGFQISFDNRKLTISWDEGADE